MPDYMRATPGQIADWQRRLCGLLSEMENAEDRPGWEVYDDKLSTLVRYALDEVESRIREAARQAVVPDAH